MISAELLNRSGVWTSISDAIVTEMCLQDAGNDFGNLRSVPRLEEDSNNFYPLQIISNADSRYKLKFVDTKLTKCGEGNRQIGKGKRWICSALKKLRREVNVFRNVRESILEETSSKAEFHPHVQIVQSVHHSTNHKPPTDDGIVNRVSLDITDIHVRRVDPRRLLGCYLNDYQDEEKVTLKIVYETHVARLLEMSIRISSNYNGSYNEHNANFVARNCPLAYRFVEIKVSNQGVITNVYFRPEVKRDKANRNPFTRRQKGHVKEPELLNRSEVNRRVILLPTMITRNRTMMRHLNGCLTNLQQANHGKE